MKDTLRRLLPKQNITLTDGQLDTLERFGQALLEKNQVMNLTAITEPEKVAELHFYDCLALLNAADFRGKRVVDIGCGAGFPGVPLKIAEPSMDLTLLELSRQAHGLAARSPAGIAGRSQRRDGKSGGICRELPREL